MARASAKGLAPLKAMGLARGLGSESAVVLAAALAVEKVSE